MHGSGSDISLHLNYLVTLEDLPKEEEKRAMAVVREDHPRSDVSKK